ncbi:MAG TPA: hypothetical protein VMM12_09530 [Longimicrobiales bacterium]|nr:hypothetical protein [Longimicrobiales bacterium]
MTRRPKRYGGFERDLEEITRGDSRKDRHGRRDPDELGRSARPRRASEAEIWEREESLDDDDLDVDHHPHTNQLDRQDRTR